MKVIFLDFDGVLNSSNYLLGREGSGVVIDPSRMALLKQIVDATGAKLVLSTSWREHWSKNTAECNDTGVLINDIFSKFGLRLLDKTPTLRTAREWEIKSWLDGHPEVENYVVLDDRLMHAPFLEEHFVKTSFHFDGLDETDAQKAIDILNR